MSKYMIYSKLYGTVAIAVAVFSILSTLSCGTHAQGGSLAQPGTSVEPVATVTPTTATPQPVAPARLSTPIQKNIKWAIVNVSDAFMRAEPRYGSECVSQTRMGTLVQVLEHKGYWVRIKTPEPYEGWVNELALAPTRELSPEEQKASKLYGATLKPMTLKEARKYLDSDKYIVLRPTSVEKDILGYGAENVITTVQMGNILRALPSRDTNIAKVLLPDGKDGFLGRSCVRDFREWAEDEAAEPDGKKAEDIVALARSFLGCPYLWGGMSPGHFDCSGLTGFCYFMNGILLPRDASQQVKCGIEIPFEQMQKGDLVFFGDTSVGHVALCIGDHKIIHASQLVRTNSLVPGEPDYYGRGILHIRRILGHLSEGELPAIYTKDSPAYFGDVGA